MYKSLNGLWKFDIVKTPAQRPTNFFEPNLDVSKWSGNQVPSN
ncbi:hypothetical protein [Flavobacterium sp. 3-210]